MQEIDGHRGRGTEEKHGPRQNIQESIADVDGGKRLGTLPTAVGPEEPMLKEGRVHLLRLRPIGAGTTGGAGPPTPARRDSRRTRWNSMLTFGTGSYSGAAKPR